MINLNLNSRHTSELEAVKQFNRSVRISIPLTVSLSAYAANDVVGGLIKVPFKGYGNGGEIRHITVADDDNVKAPLSFYFFRSLPTSILDNSAFAPAFEDLKNLMLVVEVAASDYRVLNSNAWAIKNDINTTVDPESDTLYVYAVTTATPTYSTTSALEVSFTMWVD